MEFIYEWKKIIKNPVIWGMLLVFIVFDIYKIAMIRNQENEEIAGHNKIYEQVKGNLTNEKIDFVVTQYKKYKKKVDAGNYSQKGGQKGTYTGYIYGDYAEFETFFEDYEYIYKYREENAKIVRKAKKNCRLLAANRYEVRRNRLIQKWYSNRWLYAYYDMTGPQKWMEYEYSSVFLFVMLMLLIPNLIQQERESKMYEIIKTTEKGYRRYGSVRMLAIFSWCFSLVLIFQMVDYLMFQYFYDMSGIGQPLYAISDYSLTAFSGSVFSCVIWLAFLQYAGGCFWASVILCLIKFIRHSVVTIGVTIGIFIAAIWLFMNTRISINPMVMFAGCPLLKECRMINIADFPVEIIVLNLVVILVATVLLNVVILRVEKKQV